MLKEKLMVALLSARALDEDGVSLASVTTASARLIGLWINITADSRTGSVKIIFFIFVLFN